MMRSMAEAGEPCLRYLRYWINKEFLAIGLFAFGGAGVRMALSVCFSHQSLGTSSDELSIQLFYNHTYIAANMIGCFIMGWLLHYSQHINAIDPALYKGLTTGFCGCTTTFSTWMNSCVTKVFHSSFYTAFVTIFLEFLIFWASFDLGSAAASLGELWGPILTRTSGEAMMQRKAPDIEDHSSLELTTVDRDQSLTFDQHIGTDDDKDNSGIVQVSSIEPTTDGLPNSKSAVPPADNREQHLEYWWAGAFLFVALGVWCVVGISSIIGFYSVSSERTVVLRSVGLAPFGAWLRWSLSRSDLRNFRKNMCIPTLIANLTAVTITCLLLVLSSSTWVGAINGGFDGSLSTVSTFFSELRSLYRDHKNGPFKALRYCLTTVICSVGIIQIIRSIAQNV